MQADWRPGAGIEALRLRARLNHCIRAFFESRGVLEVETPLMSAAGNTEPNIRSFELDVHHARVVPAGHRPLPLDG